MCRFYIFSVILSCKVERFRRNCICVVAFDIVGDKQRNIVTKRGAIESHLVQKPHEQIQTRSLDPHPGS